MPNFDIIKETSPDFNNFRVASVQGMFDLQREAIKEHFVGNLDIENLTWNIGIIYGASGTGKSTIARELFGKENFFNGKYEAKSVIEDMPNLPVKDICQMFNSVGFSSPKSWLKPYSVLSNGEKMRVDLANAILSNKDITVFDEYTSVVNREVAKVGSFALQKAIRRANKKFIAVSCHDDIIDWLEPDWVFCTDNMQFSVCKKKDQKLTLTFLQQTTPRGAHIASITI